MINIDDEIYNINAKISDQKDNIIALADLIYGVIDEIINHNTNTNDAMRNDNLKCIQHQLNRMLEKK